MSGCQEGRLPAALGFRHAAEWERHEATWLGWPANTSDWPGKFCPIPWVYGEIVRKLAPGERVRVLCADTPRQAAARRVLERAGVDLAQVEFFRFPSDRGWTRDSGPIFLRRDGRDPEAAVVRFGFNAWARYPDWDKDRRVPEMAARRLDKRLFGMLHLFFGNPAFVQELALANHLGAQCRLFAFKLGQLESILGERFPHLNDRVGAEGLGANWLRDPRHAKIFSSPDKEDQYDEHWE